MSSNHCQLSVLLSLGTVDVNSHDTDRLTQKVSHALGVKPDSIELLNISPSNTDPNPHVAVKIKSEKMTLEYFKYLLAENKRLQVKADKTSEALLTMQQTTEQFRKQIIDLRAVTPNAGRTPSSPRDPRIPAHKRLEANNKLLSNEVEELRAKLIKSERFKKDVLMTVKDLKKQLAVLTEEIMATDGWDIEDEHNDSDQEVAD
eukprot:NODE_6965_length_823_cov_32.668571_g6365_i0.p1 GENE.NODE_6965_length_823_cov_32.668571_g6365_i0~~NODE_6965_length_823_cov_32.668571_g6365_i0.p1  ORF type:complete len:203 (-),score=37.01 NODE_6965_length_823_cov_32.668571_g6365_i0:172-780(-)